uniref:Leucine-rich repeat domain, L domain-containing protein n=1 Tax=Parastrongyloides trichosuri TaxID=131310 RepID=A0A0N5A750_PARTI
MSRNNDKESPNNSSKKFNSFKEKKYTIDDVLNSVSTFCDIKNLNQANGQQITPDINPSVLKEETLHSNKNELPLPANGNNNEIFMPIENKYPHNNFLSSNKRVWNAKKKCNPVKNIFEIRKILGFNYMDREEVDTHTIGKRKTMSLLESILQDGDIFVMKSENFSYIRYFNWCKSFYTENRESASYSQNMCINAALISNYKDFELCLKCAIENEIEILSLKSNVQPLLTTPPSIRNCDKLKMLHVQMLRGEIYGSLPSNLQVLWLDGNLDFYKCIDLSKCKYLRMIIFSECPLKSERFQNIESLKMLKVKGIACLDLNCCCKNSRRLKSYYPKTIYLVKGSFFNGQVLNDNIVSVSGKFETNQNIEGTIHFELMSSIIDWNTLHYS